MPKVPAQYLEARKSEILDAAMACFRRRGFHQTTMQDIYRETGLSPGAVYRYFRSKEDIINAAVDRYTAEITRLIAVTRSMAPSPNQAIEMLGRYMFARFQDPGFEQECRLDVETWPELLRNERLLAAIRRQMDTVRESFVEMFKQAQAEAHLGGPERLPPVDLYNLVSAVYQGLRLNVLLEPEAVDPQGVFQVLLQLLRRPEGAPAPASAATVDEGG